MQTRHVVVTGGTGALGTAVVKSLVELELEVHVPTRRDRTTGEWPLAKHPRVHLTAGIDVTDEAQVVAYYASLPVLWASVHCAGGYTAGSLRSTSGADLRHMLALNVESAFLCCREATKHFADRGRLVNIASRQAFQPATGAGAVAYTAAKAGLMAMTAALGQELAPAGVVINAVAPGILDTPANREAMPDVDLQELVTPEQVADAVVFLVTTDKDTGTGGLLTVLERA